MAWTVAVAVAISVLVSILILVLWQRSTQVGCAAGDGHLFYSSWQRLFEAAILCGNDLVAAILVGNSGTAGRLGI